MLLVVERARMSYAGFAFCFFRKDLAKRARKRAKMLASVEKHGDWGRGEVAERPSKHAKRAFRVVFGEWTKRSWMTPKASLSLASKQRLASGWVISNEAVDEPSGR